MTFYLVILEPSPEPPSEAMPLCLSIDGYGPESEDNDRAYGMWVVADYGAAQYKLAELLPLDPGFKVHLAGPYNFGEDILDDRVYYTVAFEQELTTENS